MEEMTNAILSVTDAKEIGSRIHYHRKQKEITMAGLGKQIGVNKSTIQRYESGRILHIKLPVLKAIAEILNVSPEYLLLQTDNPTAETSRTSAKQLKNDTFGLFQKRFGKRFTKERIENPEKYDDFNIDIETILICLREEPRQSEKVLEAHIRWCHSFESEKSKEFPCTIEGAKQACAWLDEQRLLFIEKLL